jgi:hypothetical protein
MGKPWRHPGFVGCAIPVMACTVLKNHIFVKLRKDPLDYAVVPMAPTLTDGHSERYQDASTYTWWRRK